ncbi:hypothetical protein FCIRC_2037 [Fusarium circinatum]|uniref:Uncharacterized protein n=1 Tax=Fusarium circinatum TaxID=48490 RepID=A0A8H5X9Q6_FUSCI|nr:hypothetical protein FCIRC_2037 [Fusarium circinatum]
MSSSSKEAMAKYPRPPPRPPEKPKRDVQNRKVIFFTLDTLFNRNCAIECALERCRQINPDLGSKTLEELKRGYRDAMAEAYRRLIHTRLHGSSGPAGLLPNSPPQVLNDKVGMMFQQLNLNPPSASERKRIGREFGAAFNRNRFETYGASQALLQLRHLEYTIVVVDDALDWHVVKDLNFWLYIDAKIIPEELVVRKPDPRVFQKALNAYGVSPKNAVIVGCSIEEDIAGILNTGAEPILYMPGYHHMTMDFRGTRVVVVRTMDELLSEMKRRPENSHLVPLQQQQQVPPVPYPIHPQMVYAPQNQGHSNNQNSQPSSQSHHPPSDPKPDEDGHAGQSRKRPRPSSSLFEPGPSNETPGNYRLPDRGHSTREYERNVRPTPPLSPSTSTRTYLPRAPTPARELERPNGDGSDRSYPANSPLAHRPRSPSPPRTLPPMRMYPPTEDYGISRPANVENLCQPRSPNEGYGHGTSRDRHTTQGGYSPPPPPISPYQSPTPNRGQYRDQGRSQQDSDRNETSGNGYPTQGGYSPETPIPYRTSSLCNAGHHDTVAGPSGQRRRTSRELREIAQSMLDLSRGHPRVSVDGVPEGGEDEGRQ